MFGKFHFCFSRISGSSASGSSRREKDKKKSSSPAGSGGSDTDTVASSRIDPNENVQIRPSLGVPQDVSGSRQSFRMAMGNPCEFFVDVMWFVLWPLYSQWETSKQFVSNQWKALLQTNALQMEEYCTKWNFGDRMETRRFSLVGNGKINPCAWLLYTQNTKTPYAITRIFRLQIIIWQDKWI